MSASATTSLRARARTMALFCLFFDGAIAWGVAGALGNGHAVCTVSQQPLSVTAAVARPAAQATTLPQTPLPQRRRQRVTMMAGRGRGRMRYPPQPVKKDTTPINGAIPFDEMRVMVDSGDGSDEMLGVMNKDDALAAARERELDLVLIAAKSDPPVVKIVSYDKFRFAKEKKRKEQQKAASR